MNPKEIKAVIFDFDDTIAKMPTKIKLFHEENRDYVGLSTSGFAKHKGSIGKTGLLKHCRFDSKTFEEFCTHEDKSYFIEDVVEILRRPDYQWQALYFEYFMEMLSTEEDSQNVYILSARGHDPSEFLKGLRILQTYFEKNHGLKIFLPRKEHLHFVGKQPNIPLAKASVIESIVLKEAGENTTRIEFADDDEDNIEKARHLLEALQENFGHISFVLSHVLEDRVHKHEIQK